MAVRDSKQNPAVHLKTQSGIGVAINRGITYRKSENKDIEKLAAEKCQACVNFSRCIEKVEHANDDIF